MPRPHSRLVLCCLAVVTFLGCGPGTASPQTKHPALAHPTLVPLTATPDLGQEFLSQAGALCEQSYQLSPSSAPGTIPGQIAVLWDVASGQVLHILRGHIAHEVAFSPDGKTLASAGDTTVQLWDVASGQAVRTLESVASNSAGMRSIAFSPDGKKLAAGASSNLTKDATLTMWDLETGEGQTLATTAERYDIESVAFSADGRLLTSGGGDWFVALWDAATGQMLRTIRGGYAQVTSVAFSPDGLTLAAGYWDNVVVLWPVGR